MGFFKAFGGFLSGSVGNGLPNDPRDIKTVKRNLKKAGYFDEDTENGFITRALDDSIRKFQRDQNLRVDGLLSPGGETERSLFETLEQQDPNFAFGPEYEDGGDVGFGGNPSGTIEVRRNNFYRRYMEGERTAPTTLEGPLVDWSEDDFGGDVVEDEISAEKAPLEEKSSEENALKEDTGSQDQDGEGNSDHSSSPEAVPDKAKPSPVPDRKPEIISPTQKGNELLDFIGKLESSDNYNVIYGNEEKPLTNMTVKEVQELQQKMIDEGRGSSAVGRYQFLKGTLNEAVNKLGIDEDTIFDEKLQDRLARSRLEFRGFEKYKAGEISTEAFIKKLANEWAALPLDASNRSRYEGVLNNKVLTDFKTLKDLLEK